MRVKFVAFLALFCVLFCHRGFADVVPVPFGAAANTSFADDVADDRQGGWTDQGGNDLRVIEPGRHEHSGVVFDIASDAAAGGKSCIVLGGKPRPYLPQEAEIPVAAQGGEAVFYLLHAGAWCPSNNEILGTLTLQYADGTSKRHNIRGGRDVADWFQARSGPNNVRAWSEYNGQKQVSLFISKFPLEPNLKLKSVRLVATDMVWMIAAASIGDDVAVEPLKIVYKIDREFQAPSVQEPLVQRRTGGTPRNVILVIGDGMGQGALDLTSLWVHGETNKLFLQQLPIQGRCKTASANSRVTDSAAAASAIACGEKVNNGSVAVTPDGRALKSVALFARGKGKAVGILTSDPLSGATPAGFFARQKARGMAPEIVADAAACGFDVLLGQAATRGLFLQNGQEPNQRNLQKEMEARGCRFVEDLEQFAAVPAGSRIVGQIESKRFTTDDRMLGKFARAAIERLAKNPNGFFMMVESTYPDTGGHSNDPTVSIMGTVHADWAVKAAVDFAQSRDDTLVICTADHETGGLKAVAAPDGSRTPDIEYGSVNHTADPVPLGAYGPGAERFEGEIDNTDIAKTIAGFWDFVVPAEYRE
ncbi:MAG: alkaline phosphatase [Kiritimatiellia bacterium]